MNLMFVRKKCKLSEYRVVLLYMNLVLLKECIEGYDIEWGVQYN